MKHVFTILGCASSHGVPRSDGDWGRCNPNNPKNRRRRASLLIEQINDEGGKTTAVIDTGPDFREQMISANVTNIDAVLYTHKHADHTHGIGDLRAFAMAKRKKVPIYANLETMGFLEESFEYCLKTPENSEYPPIVERNLIEGSDQPVIINGNGGELSIEPIDLVHGPIHSFGFKVGSFAYCSDVSDFPEHSIGALRGLDTLIIDATLLKPHFSHFSLGQALEWIEELMPQRAYITHMHTPMDYDEVMKLTPDHVEPCYDGLVIELDA